jgi:hypothetical protein
MTAARHVGLEGDLQALSVVELVQTLNLGGKTARVLLHSGSQTGMMWFQEGAITHAATGSLYGELAAYSMIEWTTGRFTVSYGITTESRSIDTDTTQVLLEALRRADERQANPQPPEAPCDAAPVLEADVQREHSRRLVVGTALFAVIVGAVVILGVRDVSSFPGGGTVAAMVAAPDPVVPRSTATGAGPIKRRAASRPKPKPADAPNPDPSSAQ